MTITITQALAEALSYANSTYGKLEANVAKCKFQSADSAAYGLHWHVVVSFTDNSYIAMAVWDGSGITVAELGTSIP